MNLFTYIAFPNKADLSVIENSFDQSKCVSFGQIRGTALELEIPFDISSLPDDLHYYFGDRSELYGIEIDYNTALSIPQGIFENQFRYELRGEFIFTERRSDIPIFSGSDYNFDFLGRLNTELDDNVQVCRQQLYDLIKENLKAGEFAEIYTDYRDESGMKIACPLTVLDIYCSEIPITHKLEPEAGRKIIIRK